MKDTSNVNVIANVWIAAGFLAADFEPTKFFIVYGFMLLAISVFVKTNN